MMSEMNGLTRSGCAWSSGNRSIQSAEELEQELERVSDSNGYSTLIGLLVG